MAIFFDLLVLDEHVLVYVPYCTRTNLLSKLIVQIPGEVPSPNSKLIIKAILPHRFHLPLQPTESAVEKLREAFSKSIIKRQEGLVLKPIDSPYFGRHIWVKLKKDHIPGLGDNLDFCLVGAGFASERARTTKRVSQKWNVWHVGCLQNKDAVKMVLFLKSVDLYLGCEAEIRSIVRSHL